jgi:hypothetical protein
LLHEHAVPARLRCALPPPRRSLLRWRSRRFLCCSLLHRHPLRFSLRPPPPLTKECCVCLLDLPADDLLLV